ncbi:hypothetical protein ACH5RR_011099 [Cinchona calisaya]|uniref:WAT1-related protein n=1 Tax=Cinchona calisaya TaxID=153742 RepID=A0ABD3A9Q1_9GENT
MGRRRFWYGEVLPFMVMAFLQCGQVGLSTLFKAAASDGMSYRVFIVYSYALSGLVLLPFAYLFERKKQLPQFNIKLGARFFLLGLLGFAAQMFGFKGIDYSTPTMASAMSNLTPAFTFGLAILFRMEKVEIRSLSSQVKILGTIVSIAGALVVVLYEGPTVIRSFKQSVLSYQPLNSSHTNWIIGGVLLFADYLVLSLWYVVQAQTIQIFPAELLLVSLYNLCVAIIATPVTLILEANWSAWEITTKMMLYAVLYAGLFGTSFATVLLTWGLHLKGPVYAALFTPLSIVIAAIMGVLFLGESLYLGCVIGAVIISVGFYLCMWGKAKEEPIEDFINRSSESGSAERAPLLQ